jgi:hypothetical protein
VAEVEAEEAEEDEVDGDVAGLVASSLIICTRSSRSLVDRKVGLRRREISVCNEATMGDDGDDDVEHDDVVVEVDDGCSDRWFDIVFQIARADDGIDGDEAIELHNKDKIA